jgi:hypothetical protein
MSTTRIIRGLLVTLVVCMVAAVNAGCTTTTSGCFFTGNPGCQPGGGPTPPPPVNTLFTVPAGDTEPIPAFGTTWDVLSVATSRTSPACCVYTNIAITLTFLQANAFASLPAPSGNVGASGTLLGIEIAFDADQNSATGEKATCNGFIYGTGFDHAIDGTGLVFPRLADGNFQVFTIPGLVMTGEAVVSGAGNQVIINVPIVALGGTGQTNMIVGIANSSGATATTDCVPDASVITT